MIKPLSNAIISTSDVEKAWSTLFLQSQLPQQGILGPTIIKIRNTSEDDIISRKTEIPKHLNKLLAGKDLPTITETSSTIFPYAKWKSKKWDIDQISAWHTEDYMPRLRKLAPPHLRNSYFERMVNFFHANSPDKSNNQLKFLIDACKDKDLKLRHFRQSGLQLCIFDPSRDHSLNPRQNFPCLQQLGLYFTSETTLGVSAYYPTQLIIERAFGNYLGLCHLGIFIAEQIGVTFNELACFIASPRIGSTFKKAELSQFGSLIENQS